jgi:hypothetical protein
MIVQSLISDLDFWFLDENFSAIEFYLLKIHGLDTTIVIEVGRTDGP